MIQIDGAIASVSGVMTIDAASRLLVSGTEAIDAAVTTFDLSAVTDVDSAGLAVMFAWLRSAKSRNVELMFCNLPKSLGSLAAVYDVADLLPQN